MGAKEITVVLLLVFFSFCSPASLFPLSSVRLQENEVKDKEMDEHSRSTNGDKGGTQHHINFAHPGQAAGKGENGNGGGTKSPYVPGGAAIIPLYTAGAAGSHHNNHRNAAISNRSSIGFPTFVAGILALFLVHTYLVS